MGNLPTQDRCICDTEKIRDIISCFCEVKQTLAAVLDCLDYCYYNSRIKERILFCILLNEIRGIETIIKNEVNILNETINNEVFGLKEIKSEVIQINEIVTDINDILTPPRTLTTGPVIAANNINNLLVKVLNSSPSTQTVRVKVFNLEQCPKCKNEIFDDTLGPIPPGCTYNTNYIPVENTVNEYEVEISGVVPGVYVWSSAFPGTNPKDSVDINTFSHSDFIAQVYNNC